MQLIRNMAVSKYEAVTGAEEANVLRIKELESLMPYSKNKRRDVPMKSHQEAMECNHQLGHQTPVSRIFGVVGTLGYGVMLPE
jgi:hypothetical protein